MRRNGLLSLVICCLAGGLFAGQAEPGAVANTKNPALEPIQDKPGLPRVLLIGDSISMGYTLPLRELMQDSANVHRIPENGGPTSYAVERIDTWLGNSKWDVIHFNWGLHDIKIGKDGKHQVEIEQYEKNLRELVAKMKATGAVLVWCSTTPVPEGKLSPARKPGDEVAYNAVAKKVMDENGVTIINDLYAFAKPLLPTIQQKENVHFFNAGSVRLAIHVRDVILEGLKKRAAPAPKQVPNSVQAPATGTASKIAYHVARTDAPTPERPNDKQAFAFGWKSFEIPAAEQKKSVTLTFVPDAIPAVPASALRLRITVSVDVREEKLVDVFLNAAGGEKLATFDIRYASMLEPFEVLLTLEQSSKALQSGVTLTMSKGKEPLWLILGSPEPALNPHLMADSGADPHAEFLKRMNSLASIQQFGWMEGCVLDGLLDLEAADPAFAHAARRHLDLFSNAAGELRYEDHISQPRTNGFATIEGTLPVAALAKVFPDHPALKIAEKFWRSRAGADGLVIDGKTVTTEGAYTVGYPLAVLARMKKDAELRTLALSQLRARQKYLARDGGVHQRGKTDAGTVGYKDWARGIAWYMLGLERSLHELKDHAAETEDLRAEFKRCAEWIVTLQQPDGLWLCFASDPKTTVDTSGSAGIAAALAMGVRDGLLPATFLEHARKADTGIRKYLTPDGFLTGVAQSNKGGEGLQRGEYRVIFQMGMGLYAQLVAALKQTTQK